jgi:steroid 5-alpha reductase family enzyme
MKIAFKNFFNRGIGYLPYLLFFCFIYQVDIFQEMVLVNGVLQIFLFLVVACIPAYFTKKMSFVDIAWPWGLVLIGILVLFLGEGYRPRIYMVAGMYLFSGLRMGIGALILFSKGHLKSELSRYNYQRRRWDKAGYKNLNLSLQYEIMIQCFANITFLAIPAILMSTNSTNSISTLEYIGAGLWATWFVLEHISDLQKQQFLKKAFLEKKKKQVCNVGFWKYTRHPNYFSEWMVWNAMIIASISSFISLYSEDQQLVWIIIGVGLFYISYIMYTTLVYYTGAVPSEYYTLQKRPNYKAYQEQTNMFFPGPQKSNQKGI